MPSSKRTSPSSAARSSFSKALGSRSGVSVVTVRMRPLGARVTRRSGCRARFSAESLSASRSAQHELDVAVARCELGRAEKRHSPAGTIDHDGQFKP